jgi:hypothetical protein
LRKIVASMLQCKQIGALDNQTALTAKATLQPALGPVWQLPRRTLARNSIP